VLHTPQIEEPPVLDVRGVPHVTYIEGTAVNSLELIPYATTPATVVTNGSSAYSFVPSDGRSGNDSFCWVTFPHPENILSKLALKGSAGVGVTRLVHATTIPSSNSAISTTACVVLVISLEKRRVFRMEGFK
jgi:hypothetical protein